MIVAFKSDKGNTRETNQDFLLSSNNANGDVIYILCDGMGGYKGGEIASFECAQFVGDEFKKSCFNNDLEEIKNWLYLTIKEANKRIKSLAKNNNELAKMGTTIICLVISKDYRIYASVGDSRLYGYNHRELVQISEDQTFANALLKAGYINKKEAAIHPKKGLLVSAIGANEDDLDIQINEITGKYNYLLCSDGLYNVVSDKEILKTINLNLNLQQRADKLIDLANNGGGNDNVSVILLEESL